MSKNEAALGARNVFDMPKHEAAISALSVLQNNEAAFSGFSVLHAQT